MAQGKKGLQEVVLTQAVHLNATVQGVVTGLLAGLVVFVATNWLVLKGGKVVGPHLALLGQFFWGYRVTFLGSLVGFAYAFALGYAVGYLVARIYNFAVSRKETRRLGARATSAPRLVSARGARRRWARGPRGSRAAPRRRAP
jgi:hypothetical protein